MAVSTSTYFSNSLVGVPQVAGEVVDVYSYSSSPKLPISQKYEREDGTVFRYAYYAQGASAGQVVAAVASDVSQNIISGALFAPSSTYQMPNETPGIYPGSVGSRYFITSITTVANQFDGAYITIQSGTTIAHTYRVKRATVTGDPATGKARFELYDPLILGVNTATTVNILGNLLNGVSPASSTFPNVVGVSVRTVPATNYGWIVTQGVWGVLQDAGASGGSAGQLAQLSTATAGVVAPGATIVTGGTNLSVTFPIVGVYAANQTGSTGAMVRIKLE